MEAERQDKTTPAPAAPSRPVPARLLRCLRKANFAALANLAARKCSEMALLNVREAMAVLRSQASERMLHDIVN